MSFIKGFTDQMMMGLKNSFFLNLNEDQKCNSHSSQITMFHFFKQSKVVVDLIIGFKREQ